MRERAAQGAIPLAELAKRWETSEADVVEAVRRGQLVAIRLRQSIVLPAWQFDDSYTALPGLKRVLDAYPGTAASLTSWMCRPNHELNDQTPATFLRAGEVTGILRAMALTTPPIA